MGTLLSLLLLPEFETKYSFLQLETDRGEGGRVELLGYGISALGTQGWQPLTDGLLIFFLSLMTEDTFPSLSWVCATLSWVEWA